MRNVLCFGDSNTHGTCAMHRIGDRERFGRDIRWPGVMAATLGPDWHVVEEGHPGRNAVFDDPIDGAHKNGLAVLPALLESHRPLDLVIVMLGTNDLKARFGIPATDVAFGIERLARAIRQSDAGPDLAPPTTLLVAPVPVEEIEPFAEMFEGASAKSRALAGPLAEAAERQGCAFLDLAPVARVDPADGIHLDAVGQRAVGAAIAEKVIALMG